MEHNRSAQLDFVQVLNSILKISYMATRLIRNKSHFSKEIFGFNFFFFFGEKINYILIHVKEENEEGEVK